MLSLTSAYIAFLLILPLAVPHDVAKQILSEEGVIEILSILAWLMVAAQFAFSTFRPAIRWPMTLLFTFFAAREADLHKAFTAEGMMKLNYYTKSSAPLGEKLVAGMVAFVFIALLLYGGFIFLRFVVVRSGWRSPVGGWLIAAAVVFFICKVLDRLPNILLQNYGIAFPPLLDVYFSSLEEGLELWVPLVLAWLSWAREEEFAALE